MKKSEEQRAAIYDVRDASQSVTLTNHVLSNCVFISTRRLPDRDTGAFGQRTLAVLIFIDQPTEQVELKASDAADVTRSTLYAGKDIVDEIVSSHPSSRNQIREFTRGLIAALFMVFLTAALFLMCGGSVDCLTDGQWPEVNDHPTNYLDRASD